MSVENKPKKLLVIEDEGDICLVLDIMLSSEDISMDHVNTIAQAKEYLSAKSPDVIVLDNKLPDGLGSEYVQELKTQLPETKVLMISGQENAENEIGRHADMFLAKPFSKAQMQEALRSLMN